MKHNTNTKAVREAARAYILANYEEYRDDREPPADFETCARYILNDVRESRGSFLFPAPVKGEELHAGASPAGFELPLWYVDAREDLRRILNQTEEEAEQYDPADSYTLLAHICAREINRVVRA